MTEDGVLRQIPPLTPPVPTPRRHDVLLLADLTAASDCRFQLLGTGVESGRIAPYEELRLVALQGQRVEGAGMGGEVQLRRTARAQRLSGPRRAEEVLDGETMELALQACVEVSYREVVKVVVQIGVPARRRLGQKVSRP